MSLFQIFTFKRFKRQRGRTGKKYY